MNAARGQHSTTRSTYRRSDRGPSGCTHAVYRGSPTILQRMLGATVNPRQIYLFEFMPYLRKMGKALLETVDRAPTRGRMNLQNCHGNLRVEMVDFR
jgi:hypothetical protein